MNDSMHRTDNLLHDQRRARRPQTMKRLKRSQHRMIAGIAAGVAEFIGASTTVTRWVFALTVPLSIGTSIIPYLLLWILLPGPDSDPDS